MDGAAAALFFDSDIFWFELGEIDAGDGLAVDHEEDAVSGDEVGEDRAGFLALDDGIGGVDDGFEAAEALDALDDGWDGGVVCGGAASDSVGDVGQDAGGGLAKKDNHGSRSQDEGEQKGDERARGTTACGVLVVHDHWTLEAGGP